MAHENFQRKTELAGGSDRSFGITFSVLFLLIALWPLFHGKAVRPWPIPVSALLLAVSLVRPRLLAFPNRLWTRLGRALNAVTSPVALAILFFLVLTPTALLVRLLRCDSLRLRPDPSGKTYWIERETRGRDAEPGSMFNQY